MRKYAIWSFIALISIAFTASFAPAAEKIGVINLREVMLNSESGKKVGAEFKQFLDKKQKEISRREEEVKSIRGELDKQRSLMTEETLKEKETNYQVKLRDLQRLFDDSKQEIQIKEQDMAKKMIPEIMKVVTSFGETEGFTVILDVNMVAFHAKGIDITGRVIQEFDKLNKEKK
jgi:outer membrane protein